MNSSQFKEIVVVKDFEVENGVLGLDRDAYLSIIKFLNFSTVRKVSRYLILLNINKNNINTSRTLSDIFSFNISDLTLSSSPWKIIFLPSNLNIPCGVGIINMDNGRDLSEKK
jgi:hypothetical protein